MKRPRVIRVVLMLVLLSVSSAFAAELRAVISNALAESFREVIPEFERTSQIKVLSSFGGDDIPKRIEGGEPADVLIIWRTHLDKLATEGFVVQASETDVVRSNIGLAVRAGAPKPDISSVDALRRSLLNASSIAYSASISGVYISTELFPKLGIAEQVKGKSKRIEGMRVGEAIARGDAEIGFQQISELLPVTGIQYVGPLPDGAQRVTVFSAGITANAKNTAGAQALMHFLTSSVAHPTFVKRGLDPVGDGKH